MEQLEKRFEAAQFHFEYIAEKLRAGGFLGREDFSKTLEILDAQRQAQETCLQQLMQAGLLSPDETESLSLQRVRELEHAWEERVRKQQDLHVLKDAFLSIQTLDPTFCEALNAEHARLDGLNDEQLWAMDQAGELDCYRDFLACVQASHLEYPDVEPLSERFGCQLAFALLGSKLVLPAAAGAGTSPTPATAVSELVPLETSLSEDTPAEGPVAQSELGAAPLLYTSTLLPPLVDRTQLGELVAKRQFKQLKGVKAFQRLASNPWDLRGLLFIAREAWSGIFSQELLTLRTPKQVTDPAHYVDLLLKEGYLVKYSLKDAPERCLYGPTVEGTEIFSKEALRKYYKARPAKQSESQIEKGDTADFLRRYEALRVFTTSCKIFFQDDHLHSDAPNCHAVCNAGRNGTALTLSRKEGAPLECIILPSVLYTADETAERLEAWYEDLKEVAGRAAEGVSVFLAVYGGESSAPWAASLGEKIGLPSSALIYLGTMGEDLFRDLEGREVSLSTYLKEQFCAPAPVENAAESTVSAQAKAGSVVDDAPSLNAKPQQPPNEIMEDSVPEEEVSNIEAMDEAVGEPTVCENQATNQPDSGISLQTVDVQACSVQENARLLLGAPEQIGLESLLGLAVQMIAQSPSRIVEAAALLQCLAESPQFGDRTQRFYRVFQQCIQQPGRSYRFNSQEINDQQSYIVPIEGLSCADSLHGLYQTMVLTNLLWAMAFPSTAYDHSLYNNAEMVLGDGLENVLGEAFPAVRHLIDLLRTELKDLSFQYDGLGFSSSVISSLANTGERERSRLALSRKAEDLRRTPTSTVRITGLETCLKRMVGPSSEIGRMMSILAEDRVDEASRLQRQLEENLGLEDLEIRDNWLNQYIDSAWTVLWREDPEIKLKQLDNDSPAQRVCKKALTDRLQVIIEWVKVSKNNQGSSFPRFRDQYARLRNQMKLSLQELDTLLCRAPHFDCWTRASQTVLNLGIQRMLDTLEHTQAKDSVLFYQDLWHTPELILDTSGEMIIMPELYAVPGLEPWVACLHSVVAEPETPQQILSQIGNYKDSRWYRNFGIEALLCRLLGQTPPDRSEECHAAGASMEEDIREFEGGIRLDRAYGRLQEHTVETAFTALHRVKEVYLKTRDFAGFRLFMSHMRQLLDRQIARQTSAYRSRLQALAQQTEYASSPWLEAIEMALDGGYLSTADTYINAMQSGEAELPSSVRSGQLGRDFLAEFQAGEDAYYQVCQRHSGNALANWGSSALESMDKKFQHWSSPNERTNSLPWLKNWVKRKNAPDGPEQVRGILRGLGFSVQNVSRSDRGTHRLHECYLVDADRVSTGLKDYPHPVYKFGTELSTPMNVVCLYGCQGVSTLIQVMTNELQMDGSTIVLMDGSLTASDRRLLAQKFKTDTSGQSPFLLIDRVLALYLASVDRGDRQVAMLRCTLPYTFEVLYGSGSGAVPEEMFIGRMVEMRELRSEQGPSLVYGGRQLGKTALLNRVSKTLHAPERKAYSFCVDVKDSGIQILLERVSQRLIRLKLIQEACTSLEQLCDTLQGLYEGGKVSSLRIFVDEVDCLFEEFQRDDYEALRPFINLRDSTKHKVKFVFAGTHNVAATDIAEKDNNNLLHMGKPLCIKPLSNNDAIDLIEIPMSYLGFKIGMPQIELILSNTNSYPGLIHMFCNALIQAVCRDQSQLCSEGGNYPPYLISDVQMQTVFREQDIRKEIGQRVMATIRLNRKYKTVSYLLAQMIYEDQEKDRRQLYGYTALDLMSYNQKLKIPSLLDIKEKDLNTLMEEMENMGILWKNRETQQFRFRQQDFLEYIGSSEKVQDALLELLDEEDKHE